MLTRSLLRHLIVLTVGSFALPGAPVALAATATTAAAPSPAASPAATTAPARAPAKSPAKAPGKPAPKAPVVVPPPATAKTPPAAPAVVYKEGVHFERLETPQPISVPGRIEVTEFFSYGCIHCFHFEPIVDAWRKQHAADVDLVLVPATFRADFALLARGYYASEALGVATKLHQRVFNSLWIQQMPVGNIVQLTDLYAKLGVDRGAFVDALASSSVETKVKQAGERLEAYMVAGTPDLVVAGKYRVLLANLPNAANAFEVVNYLVDRERNERREAAKAPH